MKNGYTYFLYQTPELVPEDKRPEGGEYRLTVNTGEAAGPEDSGYYEIGAGASVS